MDHCGVITLIAAPPAIIGALSQKRSSDTNGFSPLPAGKDLFEAKQLVPEKLSESHSQTPPACMPQSVSLSLLKGFGQALVSALNMYTSPHVEPRSKTQPSQMTLLKVEDVEVQQTSEGATRKIRVTNTSQHEHVAFVVKTSAPGAYVIRPNCCVLSGAGSTQEVEIIQQAQSSDAGSSHHKFLVEAAPVASPEAPDRCAWTGISKDQLQKQLLNALFA